MAKFPNDILDELLTVMYKLISPACPLPTRAPILDLLFVFLPIDFQKEQKTKKLLQL